MFGEADGRKEAPVWKDGGCATVRPGLENPSVELLTAKQKELGVGLLSAFS